MLEHLDNIINDISLIKKANTYNLEHIDINFLEKNIIELKKNLNEKMDLKKIKMISNIIYQLNIDNTFSKLTDHINNEFYAFEFILEQKIKKEKDK